VSRLAEIRPGLLRWQVPHPDWEPDPEPESPADWPRDVGCAFYEALDATVFFDPLVTDDLWPELDARVRGRGLPVHVLTTVRFHGRSRDTVLARYEGSEGVPGSVAAFPLAGVDETDYWLEDHGALVVGDRLLGIGGGGLRLCPQSWLRYIDGSPTLDDLRAALRPWLELPVELVLVSHGEPVLERGRHALAAALA
jgi:hypothetical protein